MPASRKPQKTLPLPPLAVVERAKSEFKIDSVIVGVSCGKDSIATLDLCATHFSRIAAYFLYLVPGLSFQERYLSYLERRYSIQIIRLPHFGLASLLRSATFRYPRLDALAAANLKPRHIDAHLRKLTGYEWIATGEKAIDSVERNAMIRQARGISVTRHRLFPLAYWSHSTVYNHLKSRQIALSPEYSQSGTFHNMRSFGSLWFRDVAWIEQKHPTDFAKIVEMFPFVPGQLVRYQERERRALEEGQAVDGQA